MWAVAVVLKMPAEEERDDNEIRRQDQNDKREIKRAVEMVRHGAVDFLFTNF